ncbi:MAG: SDR family oxidoreductase [Ktedonobacteraceae bacterium]|nr:SDR family oxidoreductase [Ktedonobacteraceae bacterium]
MKLLILGGTVFLGRALVEAAQQHGHEVTLFNRGKSAPTLFPDVEQIHGDRATDLAALKGRNWDAVIDTCGYVPRITRIAAETLAEAVDRYVFISSISAYADFSKPGLDESHPVATLQDPQTEEITNETYGALKALCEQAVEQAMPGRALIIRPGLIVGPHDRSDRFTSWVCRVARGGEMMAPGNPGDAIQIIDVRDLAEWTVRMAEARKTGVYNATGPAEPLSMRTFLEECQAVSRSNAQFVWVDEPFLVERDIILQPWVPAEYEGMRSANCGRAIADGLTFRPLSETIQATLEWKGDSELRYGLKPEQEEKLLSDWKSS